MSEKINLSDFFDFSNLEQVEKFTAVANGLIKDQSDRIKELIAVKKELKKADQDTSKELTELGKSLKSVSLATEQSKEEAKKLVESVEKESRALQVIREQYKHAKDDVNNLTQKNKELQETLKQLEVTVQKQTKANVAQAGSLADLRKRTTDAKKDFESLGKSVDDVTKANALDKYVKLKAELDSVNKSTSEAVKAAAAQEGSYNALQLEITKLTRDLKNMKDAFGENAPEAKKLQDQIFENEQKLKDFDASINKFNRNVGNYGTAFSGAFGVLKKEFDSVGAKLNELRKDEEGNAQTIKALSQQYVLLGNIVESQESGFINMAQEIKSNQKAIEQLTVAYGEDSAVVKELIQTNAELRDSQGDLIATQKTLGSDTFVFDGLIQSAQGLASVYGVAEGAAALFGEENEELQKQMVKLQAVMTIITSLQGIMNTVQKEGAAVQLLSTVREKALAAAMIVKNFVLTGSTTATVVNTAATAAQGTATVATTAATRAASLSLVALRGALIATGIGAIVVLLIAAADAMGFFGDETAETAEKTEELNKKREDLLKSLNEEATVREKIRNAGKGGLDNLNRELKLLEARGAANRTIYEKEQAIRNEELKNLQIRFYTIQGNLEQETELKKEIADKQNEILAAQFAYEKSLRDQAEEERKKRLDAQKKEFEEAKKLNEDVLKNRPERREQAPPPEIKINFDERLAQWELLYNKQVLALKKARYEGEITEREYELAVEQIHVNGLQSRLDTLIESNASQQDIVQAEIDLFDAKEQQKTTILEEEEKKRTEIKQKEDELRQQLDEEMTALGIQLANLPFETARLRREEELAELQEQRSVELELAGENARQKEKINKEFDRKERKLKADAAKAERDQALFNIALATAVAAIKSLAATPLPAGAVMLALTLALGAVQAAAVLARPLPKYAKGTENAQEGFAIVDEEGPELHISGGKSYLGSNKGPRLTYLKRGDKIKTAAETERILQSRMPLDMMHSFERGQERLSDIVITPSTDIDKLIPHINKLGEVFQNKPVFSLSMKNGDLKLASTKNGNEVEYFNFKGIQL